MKKVVAAIVAISMFGCSPASISKKKPSMDEQMVAMMKIRESHLEGNIPTGKSFSLFLQRDLDRYFSNLFNVQVSTKYQLLRDQPTQSGISLPKYYLWATIRKENSITEFGVVEVAAMNKEKFEVFTYLESSVIVGNPISLKKNFPVVLHERIEQLSSGI